ncbi:MAG: DUF3127 domain-containing protein [Candidatus Peribacteria bacterium]|jgi:hypothetical protein|nr:DUF3127 domain-containing protein [Candidatus Peribacteria bacterium]
MTIEGKIIFISEETTVGQKQLPKISFVIEEHSDREFKNSIMVDLLGDKVDMIKAFKEGDNVKVFLNYRAREYDGRWFNSIGAWKIESLGASASASNEDDLPF